MSGAWGGRGAASIWWHDELASAASTTPVGARRAWWLWLKLLQELMARSRAGSCPTLWLSRRNCHDDYLFLSKRTIKWCLRFIVTDERTIAEFFGEGFMLQLLSPNFQAWTLGS